MTDKYISFYFDTSVSPVFYGVCVWSGSAQYRNESRRSQDGYYSGYRAENIKITLDEIDSGVLSLRDLGAFVSNYSEKRITTSANDRIILDKSPEMAVLENELKKTYKLYKVELVERDTTITEQVTKYSMMFDRDRFFVGSFQVEPDLIFDEISNINLIDSVYTDEQISFPMTQALLVGCHYLEKQYRSHSFAVGRKLENPFSGYGHQSRDSLFRGF